MLTVKVQTAQNVEIEYEIASLSDRILAYLLDLVFILAYYIVAALIFVLIKSVLPDVHFAIPLIILFLPLFFYDLIFEIFFNGQSPAKRIRKIKVIRMDGLQPTIGNYLLRWLLRIVDISLSYGGAAIATILIGGKGQRLGDLAAGTTVISLKERAQLDDTIFAELDENYEPVFPQAADLNDKTIATLKETLNIKMQGEMANVNHLKLINKAKEALQRRMGIESDMQAKDFLETVIKDYNGIKGKLNF